MNIVTFIIIILFILSLVTETWFLAWFLGCLFIGSVYYDLNEED